MNHITLNAVHNYSHSASTSEYFIVASAKILHTTRQKMYENVKRKDGKCEVLFLFVKPDEFT